MKWKDRCPKCQGELNCFESKKHLVWTRVCDDCDYNDPRNYYDPGNGNAYLLLTKQEAIDEGLLVECPRCGRHEQVWWFKNQDQCFQCNHDDKMK